MKVISAYLLFVFSVFYNLTVLGQQGLSANENEALLRVLVTNFSNKPSIGDKVSFIAETSQKKYSGITDINGRFEILIPKGETYKVTCLSFENDSSLKKLSIPQVAGLIEFDYTLMYELPKKIILENVYFNTGTSELKSESFKSLDNLYELMKNKKTLEIELAGHTDNVGDDASNMKLSQDRANAVKSYLVKKGISSNRIQAVGYGKQHPIATNDTPEGRSKNRRTEVKIIKQ
ncbi:MAG: OmpA family protein [Bacteroidales bacterium]